MDSATSDRPPLVLGALLDYSKPRRGPLLPVDLADHDLRVGHCVDQARNTAHRRVEVGGQPVVDIVLAKTRFELIELLLQIPSKLPRTRVVMRVNDSGSPAAWAANRW